jgi:hypothetical protein
MYDRYGRKLKRRKAWYALPLVWVGAALAPVLIAAPVCSKFVPTKTVTRVKNRVSKSTAEAWAAWRLAHPNWKPNPKVVRPKYKMTTQEAVAKVDFACQATVLDVTPPEIELTQVDTPTIEIPPVDVPVVPDLVPVTPTEDKPVSLLAAIPPPVLFSPPPLRTVAPAPTPEPSSLWLLGTGLLFSAGALKKKI